MSPHRPAPRVPGSAAVARPGAVLPGVTVTAPNTETNQGKVSTTDDDGRYRFSYLPVGAELANPEPVLAVRSL